MSFDNKLKIVSILLILISLSKSNFLDASQRSLAGTCIDFGAPTQTITDHTKTGSGNKCCRDAGGLFVSYDNTWVTGTTTVPCVSNCSATSHDGRAKVIIRQGFTVNTAIVNDKMCVTQCASLYNDAGDAFEKYMRNTSGVCTKCSLLGAPYDANCSVLILDAAYNDTSKAVIKAYNFDSATVDTLTYSCKNFNMCAQLTNTNIVANPGSIAAHINCATFDSVTMYAVPIVYKVIYSGAKLQNVTVNDPDNFCILKTEVQSVANQLLYNTIPGGTKTAYLFGTIETGATDHALTYCDDDTRTLALWSAPTTVAVASLATLKGALANYKCIKKATTNCAAAEIYVKNAQAALPAGENFEKFPQFCYSGTVANLKTDAGIAYDPQIINDFVDPNDVLSTDLAIPATSCPATYIKHVDASSRSTCTKIAKCYNVVNAKNYYSQMTIASAAYNGEECFNLKICNNDATYIGVLYIDSVSAATRVYDGETIGAERKVTCVLKTTGCNGKIFKHAYVQPQFQADFNTFITSATATSTNTITDYCIYHTTKTDYDLCRDIGMIKDERTGAFNLCILESECNKASNSATGAGKIIVGTGLNDSKCVNSCSATTGYIGAQVVITSGNTPKMVVTCITAKPTTDIANYLVIKNNSTVTLKEAADVPYTLAADDYYVDIINKTGPVSVLASLDTYITPPATQGVDNYVFDDLGFRIWDTSSNTIAGCAAFGNKYFLKFSSATASECRHCDWKLNPVNGDKILLLKTPVAATITLDIDCATYASGTHATLKRIRFSDLQASTVANILKEYKTAAAANDYSTTEVFLRNAVCKDETEFTPTLKPVIDDNYCLFEADCYAKTGYKYYADALNANAGAKCVQLCSSLLKWSNTPISKGSSATAFECLDTCVTTDTPPLNQEFLGSDATKTIGTDRLNDLDRYCLSLTPEVFTEPAGTLALTGIIEGQFSELTASQCWAYNSLSNKDIYMVDAQTLKCQIDCTAGKFAAFKNADAPQNLYCVSACEDGYELLLSDYLPYGFYRVATNPGPVNPVAVSQLNLREKLGKQNTNLVNSLTQKYCFFNLNALDVNKASETLCTGNRYRWYESGTKKYSCLTATQCAAKKTDTADVVVYARAASGTVSIFDNATSTVVPYNICTTKCGSVSLTFLGTAKCTTACSTELNSTGAIKSPNSFTGLFTKATTTVDAIQECVQNLQSNGTALVSPFNFDCFVQANDTDSVVIVPTATVKTGVADSYCFAKGTPFCPSTLFYNPTNKDTVYANWCSATCTLANNRFSFINANNLKECIASCPDRDPAYSQYARLSAIGADNVKNTSDDTIEINCRVEATACKNQTNWIFMTTKTLLSDATYASSLLTWDNANNQALFVSKVARSGVSLTNVTGNFCIETEWLAATAIDWTKFNVPCPTNYVLLVSVTDKTLTCILSTDCSTANSRRQHTRNGVLFCISNTDCDALTGKMVNETNGTFSVCVTEASCVEKNVYDNSASPKTITKVFKKFVLTATPADAYCVESCWDKNNLYHSAQLTSLTTLTNCVELALQVTDCSTPANCEYLIEYSPNIRPTLGVNEYVYNGVMDFYDLSSAACPTGLEIIPLFLTTFKVNMCSRKCSLKSIGAGSDQSTILSLTFDKTTSSIAYLCTSACGDGDDFSDGNFSFVKGILTGTDFTNLECVKSTQNTITDDLLCLDKSSRARYALWKDGSSALATLLGTGRTSFSSANDTTPKYCFKIQTGS